MTPAALAELIHATAARVLAEHGLDSAALPATVTVRRPRDPAHGDYATTVALGSAGPAGVPPLELAAWLADALDQRTEIDSARVVGPGFVNLKLAAQTSAGVVREVLAAGARYGQGTELAGRRISVVVQSGPPDLGGHRSARVGDALAGVLRARGATVTPLSARVGDTVTETVVVGTGQPVRLGRGGPADVSAGPATFQHLMAEVGAQAAVYALVRSAVDRPLVLDLDAWASRTLENPAYLVRYTHAQLASLARQAAELGLVSDLATVGQAAVGQVTVGQVTAGQVNVGQVTVDLDRLNGEHAGELARTVGEYPQVVATAARLHEPHRIARHLEELASAYHRFPDGCRVLPRGDEQVDDTHLARLALCAAVRQVLASGLGLLGVDAPERM